MFRKLILLLVTSVGCFSSAVFAVGLGEYELMSGLNQPLKAEIKLLSAGDLAEHEVQASLASTAVFERVGVERPYFLNGIRFETVRVNNELIIKLTSREPIKEPFLNFLVELNSPKERVIREYTFLLDPPVFDESAASTIEKSVTKQPASAQRPEPARESRVEPQQTAPSYTGSSYGPVSANDTLWSIASKVRPSSQVSIHQTLVAIYRANPDAFADGNINNLLRGKVLEIPSADTIRQVPHRAALQDVVVQNREWQSGGARRIVDNSQSSTASRQMSGDARLTLATPDDSQTSNGSSSGLRSSLEQTRNQLARAQETGATLQAENDELRARLSDALKKLESVQDSGALNIADTELAALTKSQSVGDNTGTSDDATDIDPLTSEEMDDDGALIGETAEAQITTDGSIGEEGSSLATDPASQATSTPQDTTAENAAPVNQLYVPPTLEKGFFEELLDSGAVLWGLGVGVLLVVIAVFWRMRKRMEEEDFQDDLVATAGGGLSDGTESFELPNVGDDMLVELDMDDDRGEPAGSSDETFDPLGEADIYIAYGKYEQAESLLLEAIDENPIRSDLKVKLMECYAENDDKEKFESLAQEVSQAVDAEEWTEQVSALREQAWSGKAEGDNELDLPSTEDIFGADEFNLDDDLPAQASLAVEEDELDGDFSLDDEETDDEEFDIEMDLGGQEKSVPSSQQVTETFDAIDDDEFSLDDEDDDEELSLAIDDEDTGLELEEDAIDLDDSDDIALDLDDEEFNFDEDESDFSGVEGDESGDEIATKLDLARAYIDMGDAEGAKEILSEVIAEGSASQKAEAKALLEKAE